MKTYENVNLSPEERAKALLNEMSLDEKMAQINCYWFGRDGSTNGHEDDIKNGIGVVSCLEFRGVKYSDAIRRRNEIQKQIMQNSNNAELFTVICLPDSQGAYPTVIYRKSY